MFSYKYDSERLRTESNVFRIHGYSKQWHKRCKFGVSIHPINVSHTAGMGFRFAKEKGLLINTHISS